MGFLLYDFKIVNMIYLIYSQYDFKSFQKPEDRRTSHSDFPFDESL